jgi:hypothetical protein
LSEIESLRWPFGMVKKFVNIANVVRNILGWGSGGGQRVLVIAGEKDALIGTELPALTANAYRRARKAMIQDNSIDGKTVNISSEDGDSAWEHWHGVRFVIVEGSG